MLHKRSLDICTRNICERSSIQLYFNARSNDLKIAAQFHFCVTSFVRREPLQFLLFILRHHRKIPCKYLNRFKADVKKAISCFCLERLYYLAPNSTKHKNGSIDIGVPPSFHYLYSCDLDINVQN